jgi:hypothetical protein
MRVVDAGPGEGGLEPRGIRPCVLAPADASPLADVDEQPDVRLPERAEERLERPAVDADRRDRARTDG